MRRLVTSLLGLLLASTFARTPLLHVHGYAGHAHEHEHHHGPAAHDHDHAEPPAGRHDVRWAACSPAVHIRSIHLRCESPSSHTVVADDITRVVSDPPLTASQSTPSVDEVRSHGPPASTRISPRAPPVTSLQIT